VEECDVCNKKFDSEHGAKTHKGKAHFKNDNERFWDKINKGSNDECWEWEGTVKSTGYGHFKTNNQMIIATRYMMGQIQGKEIDGFYILHECHNPICVNPNHLYLGNQKENMEDRYEDKPNSSVVGSENGRSKINEETANEIRNRYREEDVTYYDLEKDYPISHTTIGKIVRNEKWTGGNNDD
jgi:hypothetical protein